MDCTQMTLNEYATENLNLRVALNQLRIENEQLKKQLEDKESTKKSTK